MPGNRLGDYEAELYRRSLETRGGAGQGRELGPVAYPTILPPGLDDQISLLKDIRDLLYRMPNDFMLAIEERFLIMPRMGGYFVATGFDAALAAGGVATIATFAMPERHAGALELVGVGVTPPGSLPDVSWNLMFGTGVAQEIVPEFSARVFNANTIAQPFPFRKELVSTQTVLVQATNNGAVVVNVQAILIGWKRFLPDTIPFGVTPRSGV